MELVAINLYQHTALLLFLCISCVHICYLWVWDTVPALAKICSNWVKSETDLWHRWGSCAQQLFLWLFLDLNSKSFNYQLWILTTETPLVFTPPASSAIIHHNALLYRSSKDVSKVPKDPQGTQSAILQGSWSSWGGIYVAGCIWGGFNDSCP